MREENIEKMDFKELRREVLYLRDELARFKREYQDAINNLDGDNFGKSFTVEQNGMKTQIKITADALKSTVSKTDLATELIKYSTIEQTADSIKTQVTAEYVNSLIGDQYVTNAVFTTQLVQTENNITASVAATYQTISDAETKYSDLSSKIELTEESIISTVEETYQTIDDAEDAYGKLSSEITQTAGSITSAVSKNITAYFASENEPTKNNTDDVQKTMLCLYNDSYYYFNDVTETWKLYPVEGLTTMFKQTASGFKLTGDVTISGDLVSGGSIAGVDFVSLDGAQILKMVDDNGSGKGVFQLYEKGEDYPYFSIYAEDDHDRTWLLAYGNSFLSVVVTDDTEVYQPTSRPKGTWNFADCTIENLTSVAVFG